MNFHSVLFPTNLTYWHKRGYYETKMKMSQGVQQLWGLECRIAVKACMHHYDAEGDPHRPTNN